MPRKPKPFYDEQTNAWRLRFKKIIETPEGPKVKRFWHLCSGEANYAKAVRRAGEILEGKAVDGDVQTVAELIAAWLAEYGTDWYEDQLNSWDTYAGDTPLERMKADHLDAYHTWLKRCRYIPRAYVASADEKQQALSGTPKCADKRARVYSLRALRAKVGAAHQVLRWGYKVGYVARYFDKPKTPKGKPQPRDYSPEELRQLFEHLDEPIFKFIVEAGCRPEEACQLKWSDLRAWRKQASQTEHKTRASTGENRRIPITPAAQAIIDARTRDGVYVFVNRFGRPYKPGGLRSMIRRAAEKAGVELKTVYGLRHSRAQSILDSGHGIADVAAFLGHKHVATAEGYAQVRADQVRELAENLVSPVPPQPASDSSPPSSPAEQPRPQPRAKRKPKTTGRATGRHRRDGRPPASAFG